MENFTVLEKGGKPKVWFRFTSEIKVEQENYHNELQKHINEYLLNLEFYLIPARLLCLKVKVNLNGTKFKS